MKCLLLVDIQNDFMPGGALPSKDGDQILPIVNRLMDHFKLNIASKDFHPKSHISFAKTHHKQPGEEIEIDGYLQTLWPIHCVENTKGAEFPPSLNEEKIVKIFYKGTDPYLESYSTFCDCQKKTSTGLNEYLTSHHVTTVYIVGCVLEYCIKETALSSLSHGYKTFLIRDAIATISNSKKEIDDIYQELELKNIKNISSEIILK